MSREAEDEAPRPKKQKAAAVIPKTALDAQRMQLERLMEDPVSGRCYTVRVDSGSDSLSSYDGRDITS